jgi:hypothetical protein
MSNIFAMTEHTQNPNFSCEIYKFFLKLFTLVLLDEFLDSFSKSRLYLVENCILMGPLWVLHENYSMRWLSIRGNDFIAH